MKIVVLISGSGSNLQAIIDACQSGYIAGKVVGVLSNKADAAIAHVQAQGEQAWRLGEMVTSTHNEPTVVFA